MSIMNKKICDSCKYRNDVYSTCIRCFNGSNFAPGTTVDDRAKPTADDVLKSYNEFCRTRTRIVNHHLKIKKVIFNPPATIVYWNDNIKTIVKCQEGDIFDPEKGLAMAISKRALGNKGSYFNQISKWTEEYRPPVKVEKMKVIKDTGTYMELETNVLDPESIERLLVDFYKKNNQKWTGE